MFTPSESECETLISTATKGLFTLSVSVNAAMTLAILFSLKTIESLQIGVATHFQASPLISMRAVSQALSQSCRIIDADARCERALNVHSSLKLFKPSDNRFSDGFRSV